MSFINFCCNVTFISRNNDSFPASAKTVWKQSIKKLLLPPGSKGIIIHLTFMDR